MAGKWRRCWAWALCVVMVLSMMPAASWADEGNVVYVDAQGVVQTVPKEAVFLTDTTTTWTGSDGGSWYVADGTVSLSQRAEVQGDVHLVLCDDAVLTIDQGIHVTGSNSLTIYGQSEDDGKGKLMIQKVSLGEAGIGGDKNESGGNIQISGGRVNVNGGNAAAAIGGGQEGDGGKIIINGYAEVNANADIDGADNPHRHKTIKNNPAPSKKPAGTTDK